MRSSFRGERPEERSGRMAGSSYNNRNPALGVLWSLAQGCKPIHWSPNTFLLPLRTFRFMIASSHGSQGNYASGNLNIFPINPYLFCVLWRCLCQENHFCSGSAGATVVAHGVALPLYRDCFLDLRLFNSPDLRRLVLCYCCQAWTLETVLGGNTALPRWWTARSIDADAKR